MARDEQDARADRRVPQGHVGQVRHVAPEEKFAFEDDDESITTGEFQIIADAEFARPTRSSRPSFAPEVKLLEEESVKKLSSSQKEARRKAGSILLLLQPGKKT